MSRADFFLTMLILQLVSYTCYHALREDYSNAFVGFSLNIFWGTVVEGSPFWYGEVREWSKSQAHKADT